MQPVATKALIVLISVIALWNLFKLPYYISFGNDGNNGYSDHGVELSINLGHWVKGYRSLPMRCPPCNFFLVHAIIGITLLFMMVLTLINKKWRKKHCKPFFAFSIAMGLHTFPAALANDAGFTPLFVVACSLLIGSGFLGLKADQEYDQDPVEGDKNLFIHYVIITIVNCGAAALELPNILKAFKVNSAEGAFKVYGDVPHKLWGTTLYSKFPEKLGMTVFVVFVTCVWFLWPLYLCEINKSEKKKKVR